MDRKKYSGKFVVYIFCFVLAFRVRASVFGHSVFFSRPFFVVGFGRGAKTTGKQRWRSRHVVRYRCSLCGCRRKETLALVSSPLYPLVIDKSSSISGERFINTSSSVNDERI